MKAVVLLSGGLDSSVNLYEATQKFDVVRVLTINYGQKALEQELRSSKILCQQLGLSHQVLDLGWIKEISNSSLNDLGAQIPDAKSVNIQSQKLSEESAKSVWVPNRNGLFLNAAATFAEALGAQYVIPGFNLEEAQTFPDNSKEFMQSLNASFEYSTQNKVKVHCFTVDMDKVQIVKRALSLNLDLSDLWPCYRGQEEWCLDCESCLRFVRACESAQVDVDTLKVKRRGRNGI